MSSLESFKVKIKRIILRKKDSWADSLLLYTVVLLDTFKLYLNKNKKMNS